MRDKPRKPPPWRKIAAALRRFLKPETKQGPPPVPISAADEQRIVAEFREYVPRLAAVYASKMAASNETPRFDLLMAFLSGRIGDFLRQRAPTADAGDRRRLDDRLSRELPNLVVAAKLTITAQTPPAPPALHPIRPSAKAMSVRIPLTPEQQAQLDDFHANIGAALAANLNRNVMRQAQEEAVEAARNDADFRQFLDRVTTPDGDPWQLELPW